MITKHTANYRKHDMNVFAIPRPKMYSPENWAKWENTRNTNVIPEVSNIGIVLGEISKNLIVIDVKSKDLAEKIMPGAFDRTLVVRTVNGGYHIYLRIGSLENNGKKATSINLKNEEHESVDIRVEGYVMGAGSVDADGREYEVVSNVVEPQLVGISEQLDNLKQLGFNSSYMMGFRDSIKQTETIYICMSCEGEIDDSGKAKHISAKRLSDPVFNECKEMRHDILPYGDSQAVHLNEFVSKTHEYLQNGVREDQVREEMREWNEQNGNEIPQAVADNKITEVVVKFQENQASMNETELNQSEMTNSDFAEQVMKKHIFKCMRDNEDLLHYEDGVYIYNNRESENLIKEELERTMQETTIKTPQGMKKLDTISLKRVNEIVAMVKRKTYVSRKDFDKDLELINCKNGVVNAQSGELVPHSPDFLFRNQCPVEYNPDYKFPKAFFDFLQVSVGDRQSIIQLIESMACCLLRTSQFQKAFMHIGSGSNGKSTFLSLLEQIIGDRNIAHVSPHQLERERFATAELENKMLNVYADIVSDTLTSTGKLKMVISGDNVAGERKYGQPFNFSPYSKLMFSANQLPDVEDQTNAMYRRWIIFKWTQKFEGANQDRHLLRKLTADKELSNIFSMLVQVAKTLISNDYKFRYEPSPDEVKRQWQDHADPVETFIDEKCQKMESGYTIAVKMYSAYVKFCKERLIEAKHQKHFYKKFSSQTGTEKTQKRMGGAVERAFEGWVLKSEIIEENTTHGQGSLFGDDE